MEPDAWFDQLRAQLAANGLTSAAELTDVERDALLDLARIAAHTSERWTAPITTYLAGMALAGDEPAQRGAALRTLVDALEA